MNWLKRKWLQFYNTFVSLKGPPEGIARAFSVGFWIAWFPVIGTHSVLSLIGAALFRVNVPAVYLSSWICNPLTIPIMWFLEYIVGAAIMDKPFLGYGDFAAATDAHSFAEFWALGKDLLGPLFVGGFVLSTANAVLGYWPVKWAVIRSRRKGAKPKPIPAKVAK